MTSYDKHEDESKERYNAMQASLNRYVETKDSAELQLLGLQLDAQLKLEDYLLRFRQAEHAKFEVFSPLVIAGMSAVISLIVALVTSLLVRH